jgi:hypothetical protein
MKKSIIGVLFLGLAIMMPTPSMARVEIGISISLPPLIAYAGPPELVVIPGTYVYFAPDVDVSIYFYDGWWWRPWQGHWYRSRHYNSDWVYYSRTPYFYNRLPSGWRSEFRARQWRGYDWNYSRVPHEEVQKNWRTWQRDRYWERQHNWGVKDWNSRSRSESGTSQRKSERSKGSTKSERKGRD